MSQTRAAIAVVHTSRLLTKSVADKKEQRLLELKNLGFDITEIAPQHPSENGYTAGTALERATLLSFALTQRKFGIVWCARGGYGATALLPFLENMLPPAIPDKTLVGFSDVSFLGNYLAARYPNFTYIHGNHVFDKDLLNGSEFDRRRLFSLLRNEKIEAQSYPIERISGEASHIDGVCIPINLSLAESLAVLRQVELPDNNVLFLEDITEDVYRILRKVDSLRNAGFLKDTKALVLGSFSDCPDHDGEQADERRIAQLVSQTVRLPVYYLPVFGHDTPRHPLVCRSRVQIKKDKNGRDTITLEFARLPTERIFTDFSPSLEKPVGEKLKAHFTGIGGTGMAAVAGLFKTAGYDVSGSDNPIYPPMSHVIEKLGITPQVGYAGKNIDEAKPDFIVMSNVISRISADLKPNAELEHILTKNIPVLSFPAALRKFFLHKSLNIVVAGTHGKTTTTSIIAHSLSELGAEPSFMIGGAPKNFESGFRFKSPNLFVLEGDEYDTALFDKGPKFLHYEPRIALLNNIEFDHADIYANVEAIEAEFLRLAKVTRDKGGVVVANLSDERVKRVVKQSGATCIGFGNGVSDQDFPTWSLAGFKTLPTGSEVRVKSPRGEEVILQTQMFGNHNALNVAATLCVLTAYEMIKEKNTAVAQTELTRFSKDLKETNLKSWKSALASFLGVRRRFELVDIQKDIAVFDDFAHHPTAIETTLSAFKDYMAATKRTGKLIACFDPRNATMRRRVLQNELSQSFTHADVVLLGKVPVDQRIAEDDVLDGPAVAKLCGTKATYFPDNEKLCEHLLKIASSGDTVVFMSSGAFDNLPRKFSTKLTEQK